MIDTAARSEHIRTKAERGIWRRIALRSARRRSGTRDRSDGRRKWYHGRGQVTVDHPRRSIPDMTSKEPADATIGIHRDWCDSPALPDTELLTTAETPPAWHKGVRLAKRVVYPKSGEKATIRRDRCNGKPPWVCLGRGLRPWAMRPEPHHTREVTGSSPVSPMRS